MKPSLRLLFSPALSVCLLTAASKPAQAQIDSAAIKQTITVFADSLVRSYYEKDWNTFMALTHPGVARFYGGMNNYMGIVQGVRRRFEDSLEEKKDVVSVRQFLFTGTTWQCVIERVRDTRMGGKDAKVTGYMIGQSKDDLATNWKFFDVGDNLLINISAIMPDFSDELVVPEKKIAYEGDKTTTTAAAAPKPKKKPAGRK
ncbi:MAG TPA: hypothetical protein VLD19_18485 [Chitinophagaceae bacterium]|nr:hypothetical protein [Chitinophagaceae bacterium]